MYNKVKKVAAIHDLAGIGRCSLTAAIPILSVLGVQVCPLPTAILSCQTDYSDFYFFDFTSEMNNYKKSWSDMGFRFEGIYSGFLGSEEQINIVIDLIQKHHDAFVLVDPVMGDNGKRYKTYTDSMCNSMRELVKYADVVTPNLTECCILTDRIYEDVNADESTLLQIAREISDLGPEKVVITGVAKNDTVITFAYDRENDDYFIVENEFNHKSYSGTGDIFASIICGVLVNGGNFKYAVNKACRFIKDAIDFTDSDEVDTNNGIYFEPLLKELLIK